MLPNIKTQTANFKKLLKAEFGLDVKHHKASECISRINGFGDYQTLLRSIEKNYHRIFQDKELHCVASPCYFCGEDEVCYFLGQLFNLQMTHYCVAELRGWNKKFSGKKYNKSAHIFNSYQHYNIREQLFKSLMKMDSTEKPDVDFTCSSNELIVASPIFNEVLIFENCDSAVGQKHLMNYIHENKFQTGIVSCGEMNRWKMIEGIDSSTEFSVAFHIPISKNYITYDKPHIFDTLFQSIHESHPGSPIFAWIFEDDCATNRSDGTRTVTINKNDQDEFLTSILLCLNKHKIQPIWIPHYSGTKCFIPKNGSINPLLIGERDRITQKIIDQLQDMNIIKTK